MPTLSPTLSFLAACVATALAGAWILLAACREAEAREQLARREADHLQRLLLKATGLLQDYDRALVQGARDERDLLVCKLRHIDRHAQASVDANGAQEGGL